MIKNNKQAQDGCHLDTQEAATEKIVIRCRPSLKALYRSHANARGQDLTNWALGVLANAYCDEIRRDSFRTFKAELDAKLQNIEVVEAE